MSEIGYFASVLDACGCVDYSKFRCFSMTSIIFFPTTKNFIVVMLLLPPEWIRFTNINFFGEIEIDCNSTFYNVSHSSPNNGNNSLLHFHGKFIVCIHNYFNFFYFEIYFVYRILFIHNSFFPFSRSFMQFVCNFSSFVLQFAHFYFNHIKMQHKTAHKLRCTNSQIRTKFAFSLGSMCSTCDFRFYFYYRKEFKNALRPHRRHTHFKLTTSRLKHVHFKSPPSGDFSIILKYPIVPHSVHGYAVIQYTNTASNKCVVVIGIILLSFST